jgi:hypothetical protein
MKTSSKTKFVSLAVAGAFLACAAGLQAQTPGLNLVQNPDFNGQQWTFQNTAGPFAFDWTYTSGSTSGLNLFSTSSYLVSQQLPTDNLYYYNISFDLGLTPSEGPVDFVVFWNQPIVNESFTMLPSPSSSSSANYTYVVTADGPISDFGLLGNTAFWSSLDNLSVSWTGGIDPPVPDAPVGFFMEAAVLLGMCGVAGGYRRRGLGLNKAA